MEHNICLYAHFLAYSFKSAKSVRAYLYGVKTLHVLMKVKVPNLQDIEVKLTLRGLNKLLITPVKQAQPLTPEVLLDILNFRFIAQSRPKFLGQSAGRFLWHVLQE